MRIHVEVCSSQRVVRRLGDDTDLTACRPAMDGVGKDQGVLLDEYGKSNIHSKGASGEQVHPASGVWMWNWRWPQLSRQWSFQPSWRHTALQNLEGCLDICSPCDPWSLQNQA